MCRIPGTPKVMIVRSITKIQNSASPRCWRLTAVGRLRRGLSDPVETGVYCCFTYLGRGDRDTARKQTEHDKKKTYRR